MTIRIVRTPAAAEDLTDIWAYIAQDRERAADTLLDRFGRRLEMLADNPYAARARPELAPDLRSTQVGNYVLYYRVRGSDLVLVRVRSGYLDIGADDFG